MGDRESREELSGRKIDPPPPPVQQSFREWQEFKKNIIRASDETPDGKLRGRRFLNAADRTFRKLDGIIQRNIPEAYHPFTQAGAVANFMFVVAVITGFLLLLWYSPSVHYAYDSVVAMSEKPYTAELVRSLHRYSSDVFLLFVIFHALKVFFAGRFSGSRWLAWVTGLVGLGIIWFDGWLGYWLVWDDRGAMIASATARMIDVLPFFAEPLKSSFLTDDSFNSLLFLIVFFLHMLIPIGFGIVLWLHVSRLSQPSFLTNWKFSAILFGSLVVVSLLYPADTGSRAELLTVPATLSGDYFYLWPLLLTERLQAGVLWLILSGLFFLTAAVPWILIRRKRNTLPVVDEIKCNGCTQCFLDCPYNAISMVPRTEGNPDKSEFVANIDPSICVSCGICVGSCDPVAIDYPNLSAWTIRQRIDDWLDSDRGTLKGEYVAFVCGNSAGSSLDINPQSGYCKQMPGYRVCTLPCAGWVHPALIERALKKGAAGVLVAGCESDPDYRLGADWLGGRIEGSRHPELRRDRFEMDRLLFLKMDKPEFKKLLREAQRFRKRAHSGRADVNRTWTKTAISGVLVAVVIAIITVLPSSAEIPLPDHGSEFVISFKKTGTPIYAESDSGGRLAHMQRQEAQQRVQRRENVWIRVYSEERLLLEESYRPGGLFKRGYSIGLLNIPMNAGQYALLIQLGSVIDGRVEWTEEEEREIKLAEGERVVLKYDGNHGFRWYERE